MKKQWTMLVPLSMLVGGCGLSEAGIAPEYEDITEEVVVEEEVEEEVDEEVKEESPKEDTTTDESSQETEPTDQEKTIEVQKPLYRINEANWTVAPIEEGTPEQVYLLTIDDAPDKHGLQMAQTLHELDVPAIFFVNGRFLRSEEQAQTLKQIHELGFEIGNHTISHASLQNLSDAEQREEIISVSNRIEEITGERPRFFRAPFGQNTDVSKAIVAEEGMAYMNWTYGYDWEAEYQNASALTDIMVNTPLLTNGANLLTHDRAWTAKALQGIVEGLATKGFAPVDPDLIDSSPTEEAER